MKVSYTYGLCLKRHKKVRKCEWKRWMKMEWEHPAAAFSKNPIHPSEREGELFMIKSCCRMSSSRTVVHPPSSLSLSRSLYMHLDHVLITSTSLLFHPGYFWFFHYPFLRQSRVLRNQFCNHLTLSLSKKQIILKKKRIFLYEGSPKMFEVALYGC